MEVLSQLFCLLDSFIRSFPGLVDVILEGFYDATLVRELLGNMVVLAQKAIIIYLFNKNETVVSKLSRFLKVYLSSFQL